ncbi:hypothetical protein BHM03_00046986, partial [Ensete ventricosum]
RYTLCVSLDNGYCTILSCVRYMPVRTGSQFCILIVYLTAQTLLVPYCFISVPSDTRLQLERYAMKWSPWLRSVESENWLKLSSCLLLSFIGMLKKKRGRKNTSPASRPRPPAVIACGLPALCRRPQVACGSGRFFSRARRRSVSLRGEKDRGDVLKSFFGYNSEKDVNRTFSDTMQDISGHDLVKALQIKNKIPRRKALLAIEENVLTILTEEGYVSKEETTGGVEVSEDVYEEEDEDEVIVVDGEVDEGDVHIKPISRKPVPLLFSEVDVKLVFKEVTSKFLRKRIVESRMITGVGFALFCMQSLVKVPINHA